MLRSWTRWSWSDFGKADGSGSCERRELRSPVGAIRLTLHGGGDGQRVSQEVDHRLRRPRLPFVDGCLTVGRVGYDAATTFADTPAGKEIDTWGAKAVISNVRRDHLVTVRGENCGHRSSTATRLPDGATKLEALEQRLGDPIGRGIEVPAPPIEIGNMDGTIPGRWGRRRGCCWATDASQRQSVLMWLDRHQVM
jgi:hypothetical protein